jgi:hypothetical protein
VGNPEIMCQLITHKYIVEVYSPEKRTADGAFDPGLRRRAARAPEAIIIHRDLPHNDYTDDNPHAAQ